MIDMVSDAPRPRRRSRNLARAVVVTLTVLASAVVFPEPGSAETPVVVAVDTSRSLAPSALEETRSRLRAVLDGLDAQTPTALLTFDDEPRWLAGPGASPAEVASALDDLTLQGNFTLLNDALFVATRELPDGGVVVLVTDGRDENSAVLVDDIARRCEAQNVRLVTLGTGASVAEKALRRLALVSDGAYLGPLSTAEDAAVVGEVRSMQEAVAAAASSPSRRALASAGSSSGSAAGTSPDWTGAAASTAGPPGTPPSAAAASGAPAAAPGAARGPASAPASATPFWQQWWLWAALAAIAGLVAFASRRRDPTEPIVADDDQHLAEQAADEAEAGMIRLDLAKVPVAEPMEAPEVTVDTAVFQQMTLDERLEHTRVLSNHGVLLMRRLGEAPRTFMLDDSKAFGVGRDQHKNTLGVPDPALSSQHFRVVPQGDVYFFVDLESTNGSYINGRRTSAKRLRHGDRLRAGQVEFEFQSYSNV
ncbi:MAG: FHA domain-containing protein [Acidobacteriota bacterium]